MGVATGTFQLPNGSPVANGLYQWKLSGDAILSATACICPPVFFGNLDANGNLTATFLFNDVLLTSAGSTTSYQLTIKTNGGGQVWNENYYLTGTAVNLNTYPPGGTGGTQGGGLVLETNGSVNTNQTLLNLVQGTGISLTNVSGSTTITLTGTPRAGSLAYVIDGGGQVIIPGVKGQISIPSQCVVNGWVLTADQSGSAVVDVNAGSYASFPSLSSITASDKPTLSTAQKNENLTATTWSGTLAAGTQLQFSVTSATTVQRLNIGLNVSIS